MDNQATQSPSGNFDTASMPANSQASPLTIASSTGGARLSGLSEIGIGPRSGVAGSRHGTHCQPANDQCSNEHSEAGGLDVLREATGLLTRAMTVAQAAGPFLSIAMLHTGARSASLLVWDDTRLIVEAVGEARSGEVVVRSAKPSERLASIPVDIVEKASRTLRPILHSSRTPTNSDGGPCLSVLALPLPNRGDLVGFFYLEGVSRWDHFVPGQTTILEIVALQAATAMDDAVRQAELEAVEAQVSEASLFREARKELRRVLKANSVVGFAASLAHEINQPLATIVTQAEAAIRWLTKETPNIAEAKESLESIQAAGSRAANIVRSLRALTTQISPAHAAVSFDELVQDVIDVMAPELAEHRITLDTSLGPGLAGVMGDRVQLHQVVVNLMTNAVHAVCEEGRLARRITIKTSLEGEEATLAVIDTGIGMSAETMARVFEPFFSTKATGRGVGLAICRSIVQGHGGSLDVTSVPGRGSCFRMRIPVR